MSRSAASSLAALFLASDASSYVTRKTLYVDGGYRQNLAHYSRGGGAMRRAMSLECYLTEHGKSFASFIPKHHEDHRSFGHVDPFIILLLELIS